jgi:hypothetical protein
MSELKETINKLIKEGESITFLTNSYLKSQTRYGTITAEFCEWNAKVDEMILANYGTESGPMKMLSKLNLNSIEGNYESEFKKQHSFVMGSLKACQHILPKIAATNLANDDLLNNIFNKFHSVAIQLRSRYNGRETIDIKDEYDVQDVLHVLLKLHFKDIRKEEWTPSYAGGSSRMDFLLKEEQIVIEVKKTRGGLDDKELGKQLIIDKARYTVHPNCKKLICFTYDPDGRILNPKGIENDLNSKDDDFIVDIVIRPSV